MTRQELDAIRNRVRISRIRNRAHLFSIAYESLRETLKSKEFLAGGRGCVRYWPSYWHGKSELPGDSLNVKNVDGKLDVAICFKRSQ